MNHKYNLKDNYESGYKRGLFSIALFAAILTAYNVDPLNELLTRHEIKLFIINPSLLDVSLIMVGLMFMSIWLDGLCMCVGNIPTFSSSKILNYSSAALDFISNAIFTLSLIFPLLALFLWLIIGNSYVVSFYTTLGRLASTLKITPNIPSSSITIALTVISATMATMFSFVVASNLFRQRKYSRIYQFKNYYNHYLTSSETYFSNHHYSDSVIESIDALIFTIKASLAKKNVQYTGFDYHILSKIAQSKKINQQF